MTQLEYVLASRDDNRHLAQALVAAKPRGAVLALIGNLGSGKTTFTQDFCTVLGITGAVTSPTFTLMNEYFSTNKQHRVVHSDLYRLTSTQEIYDLGLTDEFTEPNTYVLIEWADKAKDLFPSQTLWLMFEQHQSQRIVTIKTDDDDFWHYLERHLT